MKVRELLELLTQCDQEHEVTVWDCYADWESKAVRVSVEDGAVHVGAEVFGQEVLPQSQTKG